MALLVAAAVILLFQGGVLGAPVQTNTTSDNPVDTEPEDSNIVQGLLSIVQNIPALRSALESTGLSLNEIQFLFGKQNLLGDLIQDVYKLSPLAGQLMDTTAKTNVLLRVVLDLGKGKTPSIFDLFQLGSTKFENIFNAVDNTASTNPLAQSLLQQAKQPNPNITHIFSEITGRTYTDNQVLDNGKYSVASSSNRKNRHLFELFQFGATNWRDLERIGRTFANFPPNYIKMLHLFCSLDYSAFQFAMDTAPVVNGKKYQVTNNNNKYSKYTFERPKEQQLDKNVDADIIQWLHEVRVVYPKMMDQLDGPNGMDMARTAVFHLIDEIRRFMDRLLDDSDVISTSPTTRPKYGVSNK